jgi:hypothetical protein
MFHVGLAGVETTLPHWLLLFLGVGLLGAVIVGGVVGGNRLFAHWFAD